MSRAHRSATCGSLEQDLILFLYDDLTADRRAELERHLRACSGCSEDVASFRLVLDTINEAGLGQTAEQEAPGAWPPLRALIEEAGASSRRPWVAPLFKAAAIVLLAVGTFILGANWYAIAPESLRTAFDFGAPAPIGLLDGQASGSGVPRDQDAGWSLRVFSEETNGYLDRTRLVLLELANTGGNPMPAPIREASRNLLRENSHARLVAGRIEDPRIQELVGQLEGILREIAQLSDTGDTRNLERIRAYVNESGVLLQLEIFSAASDRLAAAHLGT